MIPLLLSLAASASTFAVERSVEQLADEAATVVRGIVLEADVERTERGLATHYVVQVEEAILGDAPDELSVTLPGGRWNGITQTFGGVPLWEEGAEVVLFVRHDGSVRTQGAFTVQDDEVIDAAGRAAGLVPRELPALVDRVRRR